ncbi:tlp [Lambdina fiscellaria nucleopolyhedrovirus]|uniref:Tlp n=1 Tax=Lambdina fiscellaria nucleopolyhedrovirus TaxID=1642929 RepID=A0A0E3URB4_9ABAC|nr:tlp [Lambdina fiscellaria nucleopolyhedrovirus]AKC91690.1 tlp [Lambdina fiscellaria nucleopolyhedrovirus]
MATNNSGTDSIAVRVTVDKSNDNENSVLLFVVQDEYHLKKLTVGAYDIRVTNAQTLIELSRNPTRNSLIVTCDDYVICHNFTETPNAINFLLLNKKPLILKKGKCMFKLVCLKSGDKTSNRAPSLPKISADGNNVHDDSHRSDSDETERFAETAGNAKKRRIFEREFGQRSQSERNVKQRADISRIVDDGGAPVRNVKRINGNDVIDNHISDNDNNVVEMHNNDDDDNNFDKVERSVESLDSDSDSEIEENEYDDKHADNNDVVERNDDAKKVFAEIKKFTINK